MIEVRVELVSAVTGRRTLLGFASIVNDGEESRASAGVTGGYRAVLTTKSGRRTWKSVHVHGFPRKRLLGWDLLFRVLREAVGGRNP